MIVIKGQVERPLEARIILYGNKSTDLLTILSRLSSHLVLLFCLTNHTSGLKRYPASAGTSLTGYGSLLGQPKSLHSILTPVIHPSFIMRQTLRICLSSTTALVAVILVLALSTSASPASLARREDLGHQTTFSVVHHHDQESLAVGATNEVGDYTGYEVWRLSLLGGQQVQDDGLDAGKAAKHVMEVARVGTTISCIT